MYLDSEEQAALLMNLIRENIELRHSVDKHKDNQIKELEETIRKLRSEVSAKDKLHSAKVQVLNDTINELEKSNYDNQQEYW